MGGSVVGWVVGGFIAWVHMSHTGSDGCTAVATRSTFQCHS